MTSGASNFDVYFHLAEVHTGAPAMWIKADYISNNLSRVSREKLIKLFVKYRVDFKYLDTHFSLVLASADEVIQACGLDIDNTPYSEIKLAFAKRSPNRSEAICSGYKTLMRERLTDVKKLYINNIRIDADSIEPVKGSLYIKANKHVPPASFLGNDIISVYMNDELYAFSSAVINKDSLFLVTL